MLRALLLVPLLFLAASSASAQGRELVLERTPYEPPRAAVPASSFIELMDDDALAEEALTWRLERGFGIALSVLGGLGLVGGILTAVGAADPPCFSLWGSPGGCAPAQPHYDWILGGSLVAVAGAALLTTGLVLVVSGLMRRARLGDERERRGLAVSVDASGLAISF